jgi:hypothetical protein
VARTRDIVRNDPNAQSGVSCLVEMLVGAKLILSSKPDARALGFDRTKASDRKIVREASFKNSLRMPTPLRPTDYGVYAVSNDALIELHLLPGRPLDARVAVSAAFGTASQTLLPNGHPKFIVFRRDLASYTADRTDVRIIAKIAREFSAGVASKKPDDGDGTWVIRNISFPFRSSTVNDNPEMYELHSEDPALELTPGRYALVLKNQAYDFSIQGEPVDSRQCIEKIVTSNGTFYSDCKKP